jgi:membrane fusion protein, macrolide-specific efflux system
MNLLKKKSVLAAGLLIIVLAGFFWFRSRGSSDEVTYTTSAAERGMIVSSISSSGLVSSSSKYTVSTSASGVIKKIYVSEGDYVKEGDNILTIQLDKNGRLTKQKAWASYLSAKSALEEARKTDLTKERDVLAAQIDLLSTKQTKLSAQREITLAKSSLIAAEDAYNTAKSKPISTTEKKQKELALQAAQKALELAQSKYDNADKSNEISTEQSNLLLEKELISARMSRDVAQLAYDEALEDTTTPEAELKQKEASLVAAQQAVELAQYKYDNADDTNELSAEQTKLSLGRELDSARQSLNAAQDAWEAVKNKPESDAERRQAELALQAAKDAADLAQQKYDLVDQNIKKAALGVNIAKQTTSSSNSAIAKAKADLESARMSYQDTLPTITAPVSGKITDLNLYVGMVVSSSSSRSGSSSGSSGAGSSGSASSSSSSSSSGQSIATIAVDNRPMISVDISEIDIVKVKAGHKASITIDAISDKTFTGKVISINRSGSSSSGVTVYPTNIMLDMDVEGVQPNMAATASIITETKDNVILIPIGAAKTSGDQSTVTILKNNQPQQVTVELGISSDTQVEVVSGISEGDAVVTATSATSTSQQATSGSGSASPFAGGGMMGGPPGMGGMGGSQRSSGSGSSNRSGGFSGSTGR